MDSLFAHSEIIWRPARPNFAKVEVFRRMINHKHGLRLKNYYDLHRYSVEDYEFWRDLWEYLAIVYSVPPTKTFEPDPKGFSHQWFPGARLNYAENLLSRNDDGIAVTAARESGDVSHFTWKQLRLMVQVTAGAMRSVGVSIGDRVAAIITNHITGIVLALATASIGAIFSSTAPDMGTQGVLERYRQITPKMIFSETEIIYGGKTFDLIPKVKDVSRDLLSHGLQTVVLLPSTKTNSYPNMVDVPQSIRLDAFLAKGDGQALVFEQLSFNHPLYILYSSGTSGPPKCIVHSAGGTLMQTKKDCIMGFEMTPDDTYFQFTTTGWMMWPFMLSGLACGGRIIAYDGSPFYPDLSTFLKFVSDQRITLLGISPRFLTEVQGKGIEPLKLASFDSLRVVMSTGAVLTPPMFVWTQHAFGPDVQVVSSSGGTDICAAFVTGVPSLPVHAGEIQGKALGMKVEVFNYEGKNIEHTGQPGELVCTRPHVSVPICFWGDEDGEKFKKAYYYTYPGVWRQGDFIVVNPKTKGLIILGRSDGVLNPSGVRFGSAEIYTVMEDFASSIEDSLCVGQRRPQDKDERVLLFVKMRPDHKFTNELEAKIRDAIRKALSARHVPAFIFEVSDIPYTVNNKKIEIAVKQIVSGSLLKPSGTVANPESLKLYYKYQDIEGLTKAKARL